MKNFITVSTGSCLNTRDKGLGIRDKANTCVDQLDNGYSCSNLIKWKDCDNYCNLCACSTASATRSEHCSGHGTCEATCTLYECTGAKCKCDAGWSGDKCQNRKKMMHIYNSKRIDRYFKCYIDCDRIIIRF